MIPNIVPFSFGDEPAYPGESNAVQCMVTKGDLPLTMEWSMNGRPLRNVENGITIIQMSPRLSSLSINSIDAHHRGFFECTASNAAGSTHYSTELLINGSIGSLTCYFVFFIYFMCPPSLICFFPIIYTYFPFESSSANNALQFWR